MTATELAPPRAPKLVSGSVWLVIGRLIGMALSLAMIPIAIEAMTEEAFGLWMAVTSVAAVLAVFNLGVGSALITLIARTGRNQEAVRELISTGVALVCCGTLAAALFSSAIYSTRDWTLVLGLEGITDGELDQLFVAGLALFSVTVPLSIITNVRQAQERHDIVAGLTVVSSIAALGFVIAGAATATWQLIVISQFVGALIAAATGVALHRAHPRVPMPRRAFVSPRMMPNLLRSGSHYLGLQIMAVVAFSSDNLVAARIFGAAGVGEYAVPARIATSALAILALPAAPLWAATARSLGQGDETWMQDLISRFRVWLPLLALAIFIGFAVAVGPATTLLSSGTLAPSLGLRLWLAAFVAVGTVGNWIAPIMNGLSMTRTQLFHSAAMAVANIVLSVYLAHRIGVTGLAAGSAVSYLLFICGPYYLKLGSLLHQSAAVGGSS